MLKLFDVGLLLVTLAQRLDASNPVISTELQAKMYLASFGYLDPALKNVSSAVLSGISEISYRRSIETFQSFVGLEQTGVLDNSTLEWMNKPRCGVPDRKYTVSARRKRFSVEKGNCWNKTDLTYGIREYPAEPTSAEVDREIARAFEFWKNVTKLTFESKTTGKIDIEIRFMQIKEPHGCTYEEKPSVRVFAHAVSPRLGGAVHFNEDEDWTISSRRGTKLFQVAVHEFGHSLGLFHSTVRSSVMFSQFNPDIRLDVDDLTAVEYLYGGEKPYYFEGNLNEEWKEAKTRAEETRATVEVLKTKLNDILEKTRKPVDIGRIPTSCEDLQRMGNTLNRVFLVKKSTKMETVYCDFSPNGKKLETWIGFADVKSAPTYFYVARNYSLSSHFAPIPFHLEIVNEGNAMDLKTGIFTAPRTGTYFFSFIGMANFPDSSSLLSLEIGFFLNGQRMGTSCVDEANTVKFQKRQLTFQSTLPLKQSDRVWLQMMKIGPGVSLYDNEHHYTHFTGFILDEHISV